MYRDPNTLYKTDHIVGSIDSAEGIDDIFTMHGRLDRDAVTRFGLDQIVLLDLLDRYIAGASVDGQGDWSVEIVPRDIGSDNGYLGLRAYAAAAANNFVFPLRVAPAVDANYKDFVKARLPKDSKDVPTFRDSLRALIEKGARQTYTARSIHQSISTGNNYQTLEFRDSVHQGGRGNRTHFLNQINFRNKTVLDIGANTGENSRIVRRLGAALVDGYEYDPYFVEIGRAVNAATGMTRVSLFQGDCTRAGLFEGMQYDIVLALSVWVYLRQTIKQVAEITDVMIFETHTLDHGMQFYYQPVLKHFPHAISLGYTEKPADPHKSRMFVIFGKSKATIERMLGRQFLQVKPYFRNALIKKHNNLSKAQVLLLAMQCYEKHAKQESYDKQEYVFGQEVYFEVLLAGLHQFCAQQGKLGPDNVFFVFLSEAIKNIQHYQHLRAFSENPEWLVRSISNKYEDAVNILDGHVDRVAPIELTPDPAGHLIFTTTTGSEMRCGVIDGHHRYFMCELTGTALIHFTIKDGNR